MTATMLHIEDLLPDSAGCLQEIEPGIFIPGHPVDFRIPGIVDGQARDFFACRMGADKKRRRERPFCTGFFLYGSDEAFKVDHLLG